ncbi:type I-G CRISPR-associated protein Cas8g1/Csx17 [Heliomicrobium undosum]|nr:type I-U CRISPR-associated protein Csx17 [Heliomicrobium undosum]
MRETPLNGCPSEPIIHYLKALGAHRLLAKQTELPVKGAWKDGCYHLSGLPDESSIISFFLDQYTPTPILAPWNGGSGFWGGPTASGTLETVKQSSHPRFSLLRDAIETIQQFIDHNRLKKPGNLKQKDREAQKQRMIRWLRSWMSDDFALWLDALCLFTDDRLSMAPLLGSGGNDGNLEFSNVYMRCLAQILPLNEGPIDEAFRNSSKAWLEKSLFDRGAPRLVEDTSSGQYHPGSVGGLNGTQGFSAGALTNPWDFVLMMEGMLLFAGVVTRRLQAQGRQRISFPFTVYLSQGGATTVAVSENQQSEIWLPLWERPAYFPEVARLMAEGRMQIGRRQAETASDSARAAVAYGVQRGLSSFERVGLIVRNGKSRFAVPLGRLQIKEQPKIHLLNQIDPWVQHFFREIRNSDASNRLRRAGASLEAAIFAYAQDEHAERLHDLMYALSNAETALYYSMKSNRKFRIHPLPYLSKEWFMNANDGSPEYRLAAGMTCLAVWGDTIEKPRKVILPTMREYLSPVRYIAEQRRLTWVSDWREDAWSQGPLPQNIIHLFLRRYQTYCRVTSQRKAPILGLSLVPLADITRFIEGDVDDEKIERLIFAFSLLSPQYQPKSHEQTGLSDLEWPMSRLYGLCKLQYHHRPLPQTEHLEATDSTGLPTDTTLLKRLVNGDPDGAVDIALRRLRTAGLIPLATGGSHTPSRKPAFSVSREKCTRLGAALLFPISDTDIRRVMHRVLRPLTRG